MDREKPDISGRFVCFRWESRKTEGLPKETIEIEWFEPEVHWAAAAELVQIEPEKEVEIYKIERVTLSLRNGQPESNQNVFSVEVLKVLESIGQLTSTPDREKLNWFLKCEKNQ